MTYEANTLISLAESNNAFNEAIELVQGIIKSVKISNPQLELDFKIFIDKTQNNKG